MKDPAIIELYKRFGLEPVGGTPEELTRIINNECWLLNLHISPWEKSTYFNHEAERKRKLLLHRHEIRRLRSRVEEQGMTLIPLEVFINEAGLCKVNLALAKGKHTYDKRESIKRKDQERERDRAGNY